MAENNGNTEIHTPVYKLTDFKLEKILNNNTNRKLVCLLGTFPSISDTEKVVIILEKTCFAEKNLQTDEENITIGYFSDKVITQTEFINNIYGSFNLLPPSELNGVKSTIIYPATEKHIQKYSIKAKVLVKETPILYENVIKPYITSSQFSLDWVYNILEHKQEVERIIYEDDNPETGFVLLPDLKWDGHTSETLYVLALPHQRGIKSLRDLNGTHLNLLKNIRDCGCKAIKEKFGLKDTQLRIYFHYQPSFYHLHVHFNALNNEAPGIFCEKSHLLDTVIDNIELMPDYYQKATLPFVVFENNELLAEILPVCQLKMEMLEKKNKN